MNIENHQKLCGRKLRRASFFGFFVIIFKKDLIKLFYEIYNNEQLKQNPNEEVLATAK